MGSKRIYPMEYAKIVDDLYFKINPKDEDEKFLIDNYRNTLKTMLEGLFDPFDYTLIIDDHEKPERKKEYRLKQ